MKNKTHRTKQVKNDEILKEAEKYENKDIKITPIMQYWKKWKLLSTNWKLRGGFLRREWDTEGSSNQLSLPCWASEPRFAWYYLELEGNSVFPPRMWMNIIGPYITMDSTGLTSKNQLNHSRMDLNGLQNTVRKGEISENFSSLT